MDASRYFEEMHRAMSAQKNNSSLLLTVKVQDLGGADAYLELRQSPNGRARVFYSTMGRRNLNFQLFRKGWQLCHNASGEMTGQFPTRAENLLDSADFSACMTPWTRAVLRSFCGSCAARQAPPAPACLSLPGKVP